MTAASSAIENSSAVAAVPCSPPKQDKRTAGFDAITVTEYGPDGTEIRQIVNDQLDSDATLDWHQWQFGGDAAAPPEFARETAGYQDNGSLSISNAADAEAIAGVEQRRTPVQGGARQQVPHPGPHAG